MEVIKLRSGCITNGRRSILGQIHCPYYLSLTMVTMGCSEETEQTWNGISLVTLPAFSRVWLRDFLLNIVLHHCVSGNIFLTHKVVSLLSEPICTFGLHDMLRHFVTKCN